MSQSPKSRMVWFDANRVVAAIGVVLIHSTADFSGGAFPKAEPADRVLPVLARFIAEFSGSEMFFTFSLFLMAYKLDRRRPSWGGNMADQARRLLVPFLFWTVFYALFRLMKASEFGYAGAIQAQLSDPVEWLGYLVLGDAQYHLHFLPTLFLLSLFTPVMVFGQRYPLAGLLLVPLLAVMHDIQAAIWALGLPAVERDIAIRAVKVMGYVGYGFAAFALYGLWKDGIPRGEARLIRSAAIFLALVLAVATLPHFADALASGNWGGREGTSFFGHFLMPIAVFAIFLGSQHGTWSPRWSNVARFTFGSYLLHPAVIDLFDVTVHALGLPLSPGALVLTRFALVLPATFAIAWGLSRLPLLAWTIGLGPLPWERRAPAGAEVQG